MNQIIDSSLEYGNLHFFITINFENPIDKNEKLRLKETIKEIETLIINNVNLLSYIYTAYELHEKKLKDKYHLHIFMAVRSIIGENITLKKNIEKILITYEYDIEVQLNLNEIEIKKKIQYCFKEIEKDNGSLRVVEEQYDYWADLVDYLQSNYKVLYNVKKINQEPLFSKIIGVKECKEEDVILNLWSYYLILNNLYIYKSDIFKKIENSLISYKKESSINSLIDNFLQDVYPFFLLKLPIHFVNYPIQTLLNKMFFYKAIKIENLERITTNKIIINYNLMEFKDGIYDIKTNKFLPHHKIDKNDFNIKIGTIKYYNKTYKNLSEPKNMTK